MENSQQKLCEHVAHLYNFKKQVAFLKKRKQTLNTNLLCLFNENATVPINACSVSKRKKNIACRLCPLFETKDHDGLCGDGALFAFCFVLL